MPYVEWQVEPRAEYGDDGRDAVNEYGRRESVEVA